MPSETQAQLEARLAAAATIRERARRLPSYPGVVHPAYLVQEGPQDLQLSAPLRYCGRCGVELSGLSVLTTRDEDVTCRKADRPAQAAQERHPNSERFHRLVRLAGVMHDVKQADYGSDADPFANVRASGDWGIPAWLGAMVRADDKDKRLQTYAQRGTLANEGVLDAFLDGAVYRLIAACLWMEEHESEAEAALERLEAQFGA